VDRGMGGQKPDFSVDIINGWPLIEHTVMQCKCLSSLLVQSDILLLF